MRIHHSHPILCIMGLVPYAPEALPADFKFAPAVDDPSTLPPEVKALYTKGEDGKYALDPAMAKMLDVTPLSKALDKERARTKELDKALSGFKALGFGDTPEAMKAAIDEKLADLDPDNPDDKKRIADLKEVRARLKAEFDVTLSKTVKEKDEQLQRMRASMTKHMVEKEAIAALAAHKGSPDLLLPLLRTRIGLVEEDGELSVRVIGADGEPESDGLGGYKTVEALVKEMSADEKYARAFDGTGKTGTGARRVGGKPPAGGEGLTPVGKISAGLSSLRTGG